MEFILEEFLLVGIFSFLDEISLRTYDYALNEKEKRKIYLECLKKLRCLHLHINRWTHLRKITNNLQHVKYKNTKYILDCKKLIVYTKIELYERTEKINLHINNDNIEYIHLDLYTNIINIDNTLYIKSKNLKEILIVGRFINSINFLKNLIDNCPKLKKIFFISYRNIELDNNIIEFKKNHNLDNVSIIVI